MTAGTELPPGGKNVILRPSGRNIHPCRMVSGIVSRGSFDAQVRQITCIYPNINSRDLPASIPNSERKLELTDEVHELVLDPCLSRNWDTRDLCCSRQTTLGGVWRWRCSDLGALG